MIHTFRTIDHPQADGRDPRPGECVWTFTALLGDALDDIIEIEMGTRGLVAWGMLSRQCLWDLECLNDPACWI